MQASRGDAVHRFVAAAKIVKVQRDELRPGNGKVKRKLLGGRERPAAGGVPFLHACANFRRQILEMSGIPAILG
jgi:hypothetical protein